MCDVPRFLKILRGATPEHVKVAAKQCKSLNGGRWKQLHYHAKRFFAPVASVMLPNLKRQAPGLFELAVINDELKPFKGVLNVVIYDFKGKKLKSFKQSLSVASQKSRKVLDIDLVKLGYAPEECFLATELKGEAGGKALSHENSYFFCEPKRCEIPKARIKSTYRKKDAMIQITLKSDLPAFFITLENSAYPGIFSDNSFVLVPGQSNRSLSRKVPSLALVLLQVGEYGLST